MTQSTSTVGFFAFPGAEPLTQTTLGALVLAYEAEGAPLGERIERDTGSTGAAKSVPSVADAISIRDAGILVWLEGDTQWDGGCGQRFEWRVRYALATHLGVPMENILFTQL